MKSRNAWSRILGIVAGSLAFIATARRAETVLLNVSYDPTRELYADYNKVFTAYWKKKTARTCPSASRTAARASRRAR